MTALANSRATFGALLGSVQTSALTVTNTLNAVNDGVGMLNKIISDAAVRQEIRSKADMLGYQEATILNKAQEMAEVTMQAQAYVDKSAEHATAYQSAHQKLLVLFNPTKAV